tara:strand:- start:206 stop:472 length:267 start_codon:yes stop_codon:yes gene_type:complete
LIEIFIALFDSLIFFLTLAIFARVIVDWLLVAGIVKNENVIVTIHQSLLVVTEPILYPIRKYARIGMIDLSPMVAIIILSTVGRILGG